MFARLGQFISRRPWTVALIWLLLLVVVRMAAPTWDDVTHDGDFAYLPENRPTLLGHKLQTPLNAVLRWAGYTPKSTGPMPSVAAGKILREAFPDSLPKSQMVLVVARKARAQRAAEKQAGLASQETVLRGTDWKICDELSRRFYQIWGESELSRARELIAGIESLPKPESGDEQRKQLQRRLATALDGARRAFTQVDKFYVEDGSALRSLYETESLAGNQEAAEEYRQKAAELGITEFDIPTTIEPNQRLPLVDIWSRRSDVVKSKLRSKDGQAQLLILSLSNEFMATDNMRVAKLVQREVDEVVAAFSAEDANVLEIGISGSATVGGDLLQASADSIKNTEMWTIFLVVGILLFVYRSPLMVLIPLTTIIVSVMMATSVVAALTQVGLIPGFSWWQFKVFTTTRIFIVVILFGAGTDFCLFLIARYREQIQAGDSVPQAVSAALAGVGEALTASAFTTIAGLSMMLFADFGKFSNSGPAIGICLLVTLAACLTLAPALLCICGRLLFWPRWLTKIELDQKSNPTNTLAQNLWESLAAKIVARPGVILVIAIVALAPFAVVPMTRHALHGVEGRSGIEKVAGFVGRGGVEITFDLPNALPANATSRRGTAILKRHFPIGESGPVIVVAHKVDGAFETRNGKTAIARLTKTLYLDGVTSVRSSADPMGKRKQISVFNLFSLARKNHRLTKEIYLSPEPRFQGDVARLEVVLDDDPFSLASRRTLSRIGEALQEISDDPESFWYGTQFTFAGTTAAIRDLEEVTTYDNLRIQVFVVIAVFLVLCLILRDFVISCYLILSVLFSYYVTIGATELFFRFVDGPDFHGLDWKVPLFLFVILVAIGEDYNIYLVTRVFQEQRKHGPLVGLRRAIVMTGGIITSCGLIMAGTFASMAAGSLRGIAQLGFALALGVAIDTFIVRPILVPALMALTCRRAQRGIPTRSVSEGEGGKTKTQNTSTK
jgi:RND superfamily putative drug exporter